MNPHSFVLLDCALGRRSSRHRGDRGPPLAGIFKSLLWVEFWIPSYVTCDKRILNTTTKRQKIKGTTMNKSKDSIAPLIPDSEDYGSKGSDSSAGWSLSKSVPMQGIWGSMEGDQLQSVVTPCFHSIIQLQSYFLSILVTEIEHHDSLCLECGALRNQIAW